MGYQHRRQPDAQPTSLTLPASRGLLPVDVSIAPGLQPCVLSYPQPWLVPHLSARFFPWLAHSISEFPREVCKYLPQSSFFGLGFLFVCFNDTVHWLLAVTLAFSRRLHDLDPSTLSPTGVQRGPGPQLGLSPLLPSSAVGLPRAHCPRPGGAGVLCFLF